MSATETPLVTTDEIIRRLNLEIDGYRMREQVSKEANDKMRAIFPRVLESLGSGACAPDCSLEFLSEIPREVGLVVGKLRAQLASAEARVRELEATCAELVTDSNAITLAQSLHRIEARLAAVLGAADAALAVGWRAGITCSANVCTDHSNRLNADDGDLALVRQASDLGRQIARWLEPTAQTMEELRGILDAARTGDAAHPDSVKLAEILRLHTVAEAANDKHREACEAADGEGWANDPTGSMHLTELGRRANERWAEFTGALASAKAGAGVDVAALLEDKARLDWLDGNCEVEVLTACAGTPIVQHNAFLNRSHEGKLRAAIDAARKEGSK